MTRKDYIAFAAALRATKPEDFNKVGQWLRDVATVASVLASGNPRFDQDRFEHACGME